MRAEARLESPDMGEPNYVDEIEAWRIKHGVEKAELAEILGYKSTHRYSNWKRRNRIPSDEMPVVLAILQSPSKSAAKIAAKQARKKGFSGLAAFEPQSKAHQAKSDLDSDLREQILEAAARATPEAVIAAMLPLFEEMPFHLQVEFAQKILEKLKAD